MEHEVLHGGRRRDRADGCPGAARERAGTLLKRAIAAAALTAALAQPAAALERHSYTNTQTQGGKTISQHGFWQVQPTDVDEGTATIAFECYANGAPLALAIAFDECYLEGEDGTVLDVGETGATPGFVGANFRIDIGAVDQRHRICIQTSAFSREDQSHMTTTLACSSFQ
jgi:hypothetical protein